MRAFNKENAAGLSTATSPSHRDSYEGGTGSRVPSNFKSKRASHTHPHHQSAHKQAMSMHQDVLATATGRWNRATSPSLDSASEPSFQNAFPSDTTSSTPNGTKPVLKSIRTPSHAASPSFSPLPPPALTTVLDEARQLMVLGCHGAARALLVSLGKRHPIYTGKAAY